MNTTIGRCRKFGKVRIGEGCVIDDGVTVGYPPRDVLIGGELKHSFITKIGPRCVLRSGCVVYATASLGTAVEMGHYVIVREHVRIGDRTKLGSFVDIDPTAAIGRDCRITGPARIAPKTALGNGVFSGPYLVTLNRKFSKAFWDGSADEEPMTPSSIGDKVLIGPHVTLNPGVHIGRESIIAAGCVVTRNVPPRSIMAGLPGRVVGSVDERFMRGKD
jgi:acetyltransferase-like isoleucine patch superfamily enzyme